MEHGEKLQFLLKTQLVLEKKPYWMEGKLFNYRNNRSISALEFKFSCSDDVFTAPQRLGI